jgi:putative SOS response-associated peptidase YedK
MLAFFLSASRCKALSFAMLTVNAAAHPLIERFQKTNAEKRGVVIVPPGEYENWLEARLIDEAHSFLSPFPADGMCTSRGPADACSR